MEEEYVEGRGRSARKREAQNIENMTQQLVDASDKQVTGLELPPEIAAELEKTRTTRGHSSRKRSVKHLAGLLRREPELVELVEQHLAGESLAQRKEQARLHQLEAWRDRLCDAEQASQALDELRISCPALDLRELRKMSRAACHGDRAAARKIFRQLRDAEEAPD